MSTGKGISSLIPPQKDFGTAHRQEPEQARHQEPRDITQGEVDHAFEHGRNQVFEKRERETKKIGGRSFQPPESERAIFQIEVERIKPNPYQPRKDYNEESLQDLARSIREVGIIQPLVVSKVEIETENGTRVEYRLIAGERRLRAAKIAGFSKVPVIIRKIGEKRDNLSVALIENIQRADLNPIETARGYAKLQDEFGLTQQETATKVGKSRTSIANTLRLLNLPSHIQDAVSAGKISESQARSLLSISDPSRQEKFFNKILNEKITTRHLTKKIKEDSEDFGGSGSEKEKTFWERQLEEKLQIPVKIFKKGEEGKIVLRFYSEEDWRSLLDKLTED